MKKYLVIADATADDIFIVDDLDDLINQMYEGDDDGKKKQFENINILNYKIKIKELN